MPPTLRQVALNLYATSKSILGDHITSLNGHKLHDLIATICLTDVLLDRCRDGPLRTAADAQRRKEESRDEPRAEVQQTEQSCGGRRALGLQRPGVARQHGFLRRRREAGCRQLAAVRAQSALTELVPAVLVEVVGAEELRVPAAVCFDSAAQRADRIDQPHVEAAATSEGVEDTEAVGPPSALGKASAIEAHVTLPGKPRKQRTSTLTSSRKSARCTSRTQSRPSCRYMAAISTGACRRECSAAEQSPAGCAHSKTSCKTAVCFRPWKAPANAQGMP
eukprot:CAMPEP_0204172242 /NCGR_PEP_ID=MMETSP0361-20130328/43937_1 /ASSEMBLY_ACC=CAM_ASM_000343 /TAXON_ID=268821 /ORGANISM="Scrippsiella Hangoei, Strain SHTV-5" /LENGTH=277 /DNA_ID=CAMNT_0051130287 /DNA_START=110 /DNA_END=945 /DNA_ORIENTATION=+